MLFLGGSRCRLFRDEAGLDIFQTYNQGLPLLIDLERFSEKKELRGRRRGWNLCKCAFYGEHIPVLRESLVTPPRLVLGL